MRSERLPPAQSPWLALALVGSIGWLVCGAIIIAVMALYDPALALVRVLM